MTVVIEPGITSKPTPLSAFTPPNASVRPSTRKTGSTVATHASPYLCLSSFWVPPSADSRSSARLNNGRARSFGQARKYPQLQRSMDARERVGMAGAIAGGQFHHKMGACCERHAPGPHALDTATLPSLLVEKHHINGLAQEKGVDGSTRHQNHALVRGSTGNGSHAQQPRAEGGGHIQGQGRHAETWGTYFIVAGLRHDITCSGPEAGWQGDTQ